MKLFSFLSTPAAVETPNLETVKLQILLVTSFLIREEQLFITYVLLGL